jgi:hypothetical protein
MCTNQEGRLPRLSGGRRPLSYESCSVYGVPVPPAASGVLS